MNPSDRPHVDSGALSGPAVVRRLVVAVTPLVPQAPGSVMSAASVVCAVTAA